MEFNKNTLDKVTFACRLSLLIPLQFPRETIKTTYLFLIYNKKYIYIVTFIYMRFFFIKKKKWTSKIKGGGR